MSHPSSKQSIRTTYSNPGAGPPIYVAGSFTTPEWVPLEMDFVNGQDSVGSDGWPSSRNQYIYFKQLDIGQGAWQCEFRIEVVNAGLAMIAKRLVGLPLTLGVCGTHRAIVVDPLGLQND